MSLPSHPILHFTTSNNVDYVGGDTFGLCAVDYAEFGEYTEVLRCRGVNNDNRIVVKRFRIPHANTDEIKNFLLEGLDALLATSESLTHDNIVSFRRLYVDRATNLPSVLVSFFPYGNVVAYLQRHTNAANYDQHRIRLITEALDGVNFLHENGLVHGNLRGSNILVSTEGRARVSDYCVNALIRSTANFLNLPESLNWMPFELCIPPAQGHIQTTVESDVYSFGRTIEEIFTLRVPFSYIRPVEGPLFFVKLTDALLQQPRRDPEIPIEIWGILQPCFATQPQGRPTCQYLLNQLRQL